MDLCNLVMSTSGRLALVDMEPYTNISDFINLALATLIHHGYVTHYPFNDPSRVGSTTSPNIMRIQVAETPPLTMVGHNYGCLIAFELAREFEKPNSTIFVNFHKLIVSSGRPPQVQQQQLILIDPR